MGGVVAVGRRSRLGGVRRVGGATAGGASSAAGHASRAAQVPDTLTGWPYTGQVIEGILQGFIEAPTLMFCHTSNDYKEEYEFKIFQKYLTLVYSNNKILFIITKTGLQYKQIGSIVLLRRAT